MAERLSGSVTAFVLYDIAEEIRLDQIRRKPEARTQQKVLKHAAPEYVGFQRPPVLETLEPVKLESGDTLSAQMKYYDYGVVSVMFELPFTGDWDQLVQLSCNWLSGTDLEHRAQNIAKNKVMANQAALPIVTG